MPAPDFERLFNSIPAIYLVLDLEWNIVAATDAALGDRSREDVIGRSQFEVFPDNPDDPDAAGTAAMRAALERVLIEKTGHSMPVTRYDVADSSGVFREQYWKPVNEPVFDEKGEITHIIHGVEDVTDTVLASGTPE
jgi:PAS domain-containing protein